MKTNWPDDRIHNELATRNPTPLEDLAGAETSPQAQTLRIQVLNDTDTTREGTASRRRRPIMAGVAVAAAAALAIAIAVSDRQGGAGTPPTSAGQPSKGAPGASVELVAFSKSGANVVARITDPFAAASQLDAAFHSHGIDISVQVLPVSPSLIGSIVYVGSPASVDIAPIHAGKCLAGGTQCTVGLVIPAGFHGPADVTVGRAARPGERYASADDSFGPGEALHCSGILNNPVSEATPALKSRGLSPEWRIEGVSPSHDVKNPPANYYVADGTPISSNTVMLWVSRLRYPSGSQFLHDAQAGC